MAGPSDTKGEKMKKERCANCNGILMVQKVDYEKKVGRKRVLFEEVPALVCSSCEEVWLEGKTAEKMERIFNKGQRPSRWVKIPIWSFSKAA